MCESFVFLSPQIYEYTVRCTTKNVAHENVICFPTLGHVSIILTDLNIDLCGPVTEIDEISEPLSSHLKRGINHNRKIMTADPT